MDNSDGFTSAGRSEGKFPSLYSDYQQVGEYVQWERPVLERFSSDYREFQERTDLMPRARETARLILLHLCFELDARDGIYGNYPEVQDGA